MKPHDISCETTASLKRCGIAWENLMFRRSSGLQVILIGSVSIRARPMSYCLELRFGNSGKRGIRELSLMFQPHLPRLLLGSETGSILLSMLWNEVAMLWGLGRPRRRFSWLGTGSVG
ncbi:hypothetical protein LINPERHAP2_LOCUS25595 [Linum perenne]